MTTLAPAPAGPAPGVGAEGELRVVAALQAELDGRVHRDDDVQPEERKGDVAERPVPDHCNHLDVRRCTTTYERAGHEHDHDHPETERVAEVDLVGDDVALQQLADRQRHERDDAGRQHLGGRVGGEGVHEQHHQGGDKRRREDRQPDLQPVGPRVGAQRRRRLAPLASQRLDRRQHEQHGERQQEVEVDDHEAGRGVEREPVVVGVEPEVAQQARHDAGVADRGR